MAVLSCAVAIPFCSRQVSNWRVLTTLILCSFISFSQMAYRLLVRRIWSLSAKDIRCLPASTATVTSSSSFSTSLQSNTNRVSFLSPSRSLPHSLNHSSRREVSFNVQDQEDFTERVINSELPVLVDFHAQWVWRAVISVIKGICDVDFCCCWCF